MSSKILVRKYMTLAEFVAYLTNGRPPTDELFERQFDAAYPFDKQAFQSAELRARCILELGLVHVTGYRQTCARFARKKNRSVVRRVAAQGERRSSRRK
ncbi:MAG: hypothetical protein IKR09_05075 [Alphaproteobacteria bacterium]|nr:hypothetical protein [Alphaproteobacteria bacterium]